MIHDDVQVLAQSFEDEAKREEVFVRRYFYHGVASKLWTVLDQVTVLYKRIEELKHDNAALNDLVNRLQTMLEKRDEG